MSDVKELSAAQRAEAVAMYAKCQDARLVAVAFNLPFKAVQSIMREAKEVPARARKAERGPIFLKDGRRLGRVALWTRSSGSLLGRVYTGAMAPVCLGAMV